MTTTLIVLGLLALFCAGLAAIFLGGKGVEMINMPHKQKAAWDEKKLCRFVGWFMMFLVLCFILIMLGLYFGWHKLEATGLALTLFSSGFVVVRLLSPAKKKQKKITFTTNGKYRLGKSGFRIYKDRFQRSFVLARRQVGDTYRYR